MLRLILTAAATTPTRVLVENVKNDCQRWLNAESDEQKKQARKALETSTHLLGLQSYIKRVGGVEKAMRQFAKAEAGMELARGII